MSKSKKIISLLLSVIMIMSVFNIMQFSAGAAEAEAAETGATSGTTGDCTWTLDNGVLTISGNGKMGDYYNDITYKNGSYVTTAPWGGYSFNTVVIESGVTSIGRDAFYGCTGLTSVTIGNSVTSIGSSAFYNTAWYNNQPDGLVYAGKVAYKMKGSCPSDVVIKDGTLGIADYAFYNCKGLTSVTIPDSVTSIGGYAFYNTAWYNNQPNGLVYAGKVAYKMEGTCPSEVVIKDGTLGIAGGAFSSCRGLTSVTIPDSVTSIGDSAFYGCTGLMSVTIPDSVTSIGDSAFYGCTGLMSVTIPDSVTSIGKYAFRGCESLMSVTIPDSVTSIGEWAFYDCTSLMNVTIGNSVTSIGERTFSGCTSLTSVTIGNSITSIGYGAFYNCTELTSVTIGSSVTSIGMFAFYDCTSLKEVHISDIGAWCKIVFWDINTYSNPLCYAHNLYLNDSLITELMIPDSVTSIGGSAFEYCTSLTNVTIPDSVTSIGGYAFYGCTGLKSVTIPDSVTSIYVSSFYGCTGLTSVTIGKSVTSIYVSSFYGCTGLTSITIPDSVTSIGNTAFLDCTGLTNVTIGKSVTSIGGRAFYGCTELTSVTIPDSVTSIGDHAFGFIYDREFEGEHKIDGFTIYGYEGSEAEKYAKDNEFTFVPLKSKTDEATGIILDIPEDTALTIKDITAEIISSMPAENSKMTAYDISLTKDGETVQPENIVPVKIPCANENAKVYRFEADGTMTDMNAKYKDGYMVFTTDHFSVYVLAEPNVKTGVTVSGTITSYVDDSDVTVKMTGVDNNFTAEVKGKADYSIEAVPAGEYTLTVSKANHVTREYNVTVADADVTQDVKVCPKGDVNGDGETDIMDCSLAQRYIRELTTLDPYQIACGDVSGEGDGELDIQDVSRILRHIRELAMLY